MGELELQVKVVAQARQEAQSLSDQKKALYDEFQTLHADFFGDVVVATTKVSEAEDKLRDLTIQAYQSTGNKAPAFGVGIRELTKLEYEPKLAFRWALEHKMALSLDKKSFESIAKTTPLEFVKVTTEPQATIATDLSKVLQED